MKFSDFSRTQWRVLLILILVNFVNYVERQIVFSLFPAIRHDFGLSFEQLGYLTTAFTVVLSLGSLPLGVLADRVSKKAVIGTAVLFCSAATFCSGFAGSFRSLLASRGLVGVGEAACNPAGAAVISASFPGEARARVQGAFDVGIFIGGATGIALAGLMVQSFGWRPAFFLVGIPGVILGLRALRLPKTPVCSSQECMPMRELLRVPAFLALLVSGWFCSFAGYAYVPWGPELVQEYNGFSAREAGLGVALAMALAPLLIGKVADRYNLITALHIPIASQLFGAAFFVVAIQCIRGNGLRHPVLARHWAERPAGFLQPAVALHSEGCGA